MKVALCLSGHLRKFESTFPTLQKYFLNKYDCDIFIHTWDKLGYQSRFKNDSLTSSVENKLSAVNFLYKPTKIIVESTNYIETLKQESASYAPHLLNEPKPAHHMASMFYKIFACNELRKHYQLENNVEYDWVVRLSLIHI
jgi:hypothetical protein